MRSLRLILPAVTGYLLLMLMLYAAGQHWLYSQLQQQAAGQSERLAAFIRYEILRLKPVATLVAESPYIHRLLQQPQDWQQQANEYLEELQLVSGASDLYLMLPSGEVIASSNYRAEFPFVGRNFGFRPYVKMALAGKTGQYYALGHTSHKRGFYYSVPVTVDGNIKATVALKIDLEPIEQQQQAIAGLAGNHFMVLGASDEVFLSNQPEWRLKKLHQGKLSEPEQERYLNRKLESLDVHSKPEWFNPGYTLWQLPLGQETVQLLPHYTNLPEFGWQLVLLQSPKQQQPAIWWLLAFGSLAYLGVILILLFRRERARRLVLLLEHQSQLEQRVIDRTAELAETNQRLLRQIAQREQTETALAQTEQELVQAAKLATIGNLAASINHEINQPLTALQSYTQNTLKMLDKALYEDARKNLETMQQLMQRLSNIVAQFKDFSRKSNGKNQPVAVSQLLTDALAIVAHQCASQNATTTLQLPEMSPQVLADAIQLEQVLVNILTNGLQAMAKAGTSNPAFLISVTSNQNQVMIAIRDNGPGIEPHHLERIFEAFFTTKQRDGLGLGLSISRRIVQSFGGNIRVQNHPPQGAEFIISLPLYIALPESKDPVL